MPAAVPGAVVVIVSLLWPDVVIVAGLKEHVVSDIFAGAWQFNETGPVNPPPAVTVAVAFPDWPGAEIVTVDGLTDITKPGVTVTVIPGDTVPK